MIPNADTMLIARINKVPHNRGIGPYNRYFERTNTNALCLELHNPDPQPLLMGLKNLAFKGAITVAFEQDFQLLQTLVDQIDPLAKRIGVVGFVTLNNGKYTGYAQGSFGMMKALEELAPLKNKKIVMCGAGHMAKGTLLQLEKHRISGIHVEIYNRTLDKARILQSEFSFVQKVGLLSDMEHDAQGDIFINMTDIGTPWQKGNVYEFSEHMINRFSFIADTTFVPLESNLIHIARRLGKKVSPGWKTFCYGTEYVFQTLLGIEVNTHILGEELQKDFSTNWS
jgi:shikimate dehydrogenase